MGSWQIGPWTVWPPGPNLPRTLCTLEQIVRKTRAHSRSSGCIYNLQCGIVDASDAKCTAVERGGDASETSREFKWTTSKQCNTLQHSARQCKVVQHIATHCNTVQHSATQCNTVQHMARQCKATHCTTKGRRLKCN